jgi:hypothetical protein
MVLDLKDLVPNGYFRTYWVQQNITDLSQYSSAVSDLFRSNKQYREERVLIRKKEPAHVTTAEGMAAGADLARLIPDGAGVYESVANPTGDSCFALLKTKLLEPNSGPAPVSQFAPQVVLTSREQDGSADLETRIDQAPAVSSSSRAGSDLKDLLNKNPILASLQLQSSQKDQAGVFVRLRSAVVMAAASDWDEAAAKSAIVAFVKPELTASQLGVGWVQKGRYQEFDGLWPIAVSIRGKYLIVSDDSAMMESVLANFSKKSDQKPLKLYAGFNHEHERGNFATFMGRVDIPDGEPLKVNGEGRQPQFFSGNIASLSSTLANVAVERVEVRSDAEKVRQTVTYEWSR